MNIRGSCACLPGLHDQQTIRQAIARGAVEVKRRLSREIFQSKPSLSSQRLASLGLPDCHCLLFVYQSSKNTVLVMISEQRMRQRQQNSAGTKFAKSDNFMFVNQTR